MMVIFQKIPWHHLPYIFSAVSLAICLRKQIQKLPDIFSKPPDFFPLLPTHQQIFKSWWFHLPSGSLGQLESTDVLLQTPLLPHISFVMGIFLGPFHTCIRNFYLQESQNLAGEIYALPRASVSVEVVLKSPLLLYVGNNSSVHHHSLPPPPQFVLSAWSHR